MKKISVFIKDPGKPPRHVNTSVSNENLRSIVGGWLESVTMTDNWLVLCDEEGRIKNYSHNCFVNGVEFVGTIIFIGYNENEFTDFPLTIDQMKTIMSELWS